MKVGGRIDGSKDMGVSLDPSGCRIHAPTPINVKMMYYPPAQTREELHEACRFSIAVRAHLRAGAAGGRSSRGQAGRATFTDVTKNGPRTHKATNVGPTPFHNISFILKNRAPAGTTVSDRSGVKGYTQIMDNARLRAWRVALKPGEATGQITQTAPGLRVYVHGGVLAEMVPGSADRGMAPYEGDFIWQDAGQMRAVKNTGTTLIEFVEFELK